VVRVMHGVVFGDGLCLRRDGRGVWHVTGGKLERRSKME
jgi:hypothetical protein